MRGPRVQTMCVVVGLTLLAMSQRASAQWFASSYGVAEFDADKTVFLLAGLTAGPTHKGVQPRIGGQVYELSYDAGTARQNILTIKPYVGLANSMNDGYVEIGVGYALPNKDDETAPAAVTDRGKGAVLSGGWEDWGHPVALQALGSYNFGGSSLWTRGRVTSKVSTRGANSIRLGGELAFLHGANYRITQPGAVLEFHRGSRVLSVGAGMKFFRGGGDGAYYKLEGSVPLTR